MNPPEQSYFQSLDGYDLDRLSCISAGGTLALGVAAAKLLRQRSQHGPAGGVPYSRQISAGASRLSTVGVCSPAAAAAAAGAADTMVVHEGGPPGFPSPDLISALAAVDAAAVPADDAQDSNGSAAGSPHDSACPPVVAAAVGPLARQPRRTTFSVREYMQTAALASLAAASQSQPQHQERLPAVELPGLVLLPAKAQRASSHPDSPASMTGAQQFGSLSSVETGELAAALSPSCQVTDGGEGGRITPEAGQTAAMLAPRGALAPPPIPPLGTAEDGGSTDGAAAASASSDLARRAPALISQVRQLLGWPMAALSAGGDPAQEVQRSGGEPAEEQAPGHRRRVGWRGAEQACGDELPTRRQALQQLMAALPPPAFLK